MTSPFGKLPGPESSPPTPEGRAPDAYATPAAPPGFASAPVAAPTHLDATAAFAAATPETRVPASHVGHGLYELLAPDDLVEATLNLKDGDIAITADRILIERRTHNLFGLWVSGRASYAIRRSESACFHLARGWRPGRLLAALLFALGSLCLMALLFVDAGTDRVELALIDVLVAALFLTIAILLFKFARAMVISIDNGASGLTSIRVRRREMARAEVFFRYAAPLVSR